MVKKKWQIFFVPQTHWDKEWYFTKNVSDVFLIDNINKIKAIADRDSKEFTSYVYDGQYSIIDDYLEYYPEREAAINELIKKKKLIVGPWYTQTDTFNAMGESIVRNLLIGITLSQKRGHYLHVGYIPDSFGFNANLPQIFKKFNLKAMVYWRGIEDSQIKTSLYNNWVGLDRTVIPTYNLFKWGYGMAVGASLKRFIEKWTLNDMPEQAKIYLEKITPNLQAWKDRLPNTNNLLLVPFGSDQLPIYDYLNQWMVELNKIDSEHEWKLSTYDEYFDVLLSKKNLNIPEINGELRFGQFSRAHKTITSSRYDIKHLSKKLETLIYSEVEPLSVMYQHLGGEYPFNIIQNSLKKLLSCQAHDSLGGCNTDNTNNNILLRLQMGLDTMESLATLMKKRIANLLELKENQLLIFNLMPYAREQTKKMTIFSTTPDFEIVDDNGQTIEFIILNQEQVNKQAFVKKNCLEIEHNSDCTIVGEGIVYWTEIFISVPVYEGLSYHVLKINEKSVTENTFLVKGSKIENEFYVINFNNDTGELEIKDKKERQIIKNAIALVARFNAGDTYDFSPSLKNDKPINTFSSATSYSLQTNKKVNKLVIDYVFTVPISLDQTKLINQPIRLEILLSKNNINLEIKLINKASDIKWQIIFNTNTINKNAYADCAFGVIERSPSYYLPYLKRWEAEKWQDWPVPIEAMESVCFVKRKKDYFSVYTLGNNEYELLEKNNKYLAITLFYGSSYIGRRYLKYRPGRASGVDQFPCLTPMSNLQKELIFNFQLNLHDDINVIRSAKEWTMPLCYYQSQQYNEFFWKGDTFVMTKNPLAEKNKNIPFLDNLILPDGIVVSALKKAELSNDIILRLYNTVDKIVTIKLPNNWKEINLLEQKITLTNEFKPNEVKTFLIKK